MKVISQAIDCNIKKFMLCQFQNNLSALIVEGEPTNDELLQAWDNILTEFIDLSGTDIPEITKKKKIYKLVSHIKGVSACFHILSENIRYIKEGILDELLPQAFTAIERLKSRYSISLRWNNDIKSLEKQIDQTLIKFKLKEVELKELEDDYKNFIKEQSLPKNATPVNNIKSFYEQLNSLDSLGFKVDEERTSVARLAVMINTAKQMKGNLTTN